MAYEPLEAFGIEDPYAVFRELRSEGAVHRSPSGIFCILRWDDVQSVLKRTDAFSSEEMARILMTGRLEDMGLWRSLPFMARFLWRTRLNPFAMSKARNLVSLDPPRHDAIRASVNRGFTPARVKRWEARVRELATEYVSKLHRGEPFDVVADLAEPLPATIIAEMIGVEPERRRDFRRWTSAVISSMSGSGRSDPLAREFTDPMIELTIYLKRAIEEHRRNPRDDLISVILDRGEGDLALTEGEVLQFVILLLIAGNETTTNLIANATQALLDHREVLERVVADPGQIPRVIEETLRWQPPLQVLFRRATRDVEVAGVPIPEGSTVAPVLASANRDERRFSDPDRFDPWREESAHLGFGFGAHFCLGAALARLEAQVALEALAPELVSLEPSGGRPPLRDSFLVRGPSAMPLATRPGAGASPAT